MTETMTSAQAVWARILPFLRPIEKLLQDPDISDIMINGGPVFIEKHGRIEAAGGICIREDHLQVAARNIARALDDDVDQTKPILDSRLPDGSRVAVVLAPVSVQGTAITIRKFHNKRFVPEELVRIRAMPAEVLAVLRKAVIAGNNILISGGTGTGKTTLLNALAGLIPDQERIIIIEDTAEIQLEKPNLVRFEARQAQPELAEVSIRDLLRATLRMRPDRILLGEVRGPEAFDLLQALNTGHGGTLSTIHANSGPLALSRMATCVLMSGIELPHHAIRSSIGDALPLLVHLSRASGERHVAEVVRVKGYDPRADRYDLEPLYERRPAGQESIRGEVDGGR